MSFKQYYLIVDTETTAEETVADFGGVIVDRKGKVFDSIGALVAGQFDVHGMHWILGNPKVTQAKYQAMLQNGSRVMASVAAINNWLARVHKTYNPVLTAYCIGFDWGKCRNTGILLDAFVKRFCLRNASKVTICQTANYKKWCHENDAFTPSGRLSEKADDVAQFVDPTLPPEPHTALEDARDYEGPILHYIINSPKSQRQILLDGMGKSPSCKWMKD